MRLQAWFGIFYNERVPRRAAARLTSIVLTVVVLLCFDIGSAYNNPGPTDPVASARCLATGECSGATLPGLGPVESQLARQFPPGFERAPAPVAAPRNPAVPGPVCAASEGLKKIPQALREHLLKLSRAEQAGACARAVSTLAPLRNQLRDAYENAKPASLADKFVSAATDYVDTCFTRGLLLDRGALTPAEEKFMRAHIGFIVLRQNLKWEDSQPICHAVRLGRFVVTAQHCVPTNSAAYKAGAGYTPEIAFRFLDRPTSYGLVLRKLGTDKGYAEERNLDYAVLEIPTAPDLNEEIAPLLGKMELFADFYNLTANIYLRVAGNVHSGAAFDFHRATRVEHSALCRPAYIAPNGLFLHACQTESGISGAPLFQRQNGRLVFVGIHNGVTEALEDPQLSACALGLPNYGVIVPPDVPLGIPLRVEIQPRRQ
jgi:hypothetical protein